MTQYTPMPRTAPTQSQTQAYISLSLKLSDPSSDLLIRHVRLLRDCVALSQQRWGFTIDAAVVLPNELQMLCVFPDAEFGVAGAVRLMKSAFSRHVTGSNKDIWGAGAELIEIAKAVVPLRRTFLENAPVRAGLVKTAQDWPFSSAHKKAQQATELGVAIA